MHDRGLLTGHLRRAGGVVKRRVLRAVGRGDPLERNAAWVRRVSSYVQKRIASEIVFCPNGDVFERDDSGGEFLIPVGLTERFKIGVRVSEVVQSRLLASNVPAGGIVLDVGANVGVLSIRTALAVPGATLYAFEPVAANHDVLRRNIARNRLGGRVVPLKYAVGEREGITRIASGYGTGNCLATEQGGGDSRMEEVEVVSLDSFAQKQNITSIHAIKCDVEGYELFVMRGAMRSLRMLRPVVLIELYEPWTRRFGYHPTEVFTLLKRVDYQYVRIHKSREILEPSYDVSQDLMSGSNFFFFPAELKERIRWA